MSILSGNKIDLPPTFGWSQINPGKYTPFNEFDLVFLNNQKNEVLRINNINSSQYTLSMSEWETIMLTMGGTYYVYVAGFPSETSTIKNRISNLFIYSKPNDYATKYTIYPDNYGYQQQYFFYTINTPVTINDFTFNTRRLRTGFIEEEYINLSPRRSGAGLAYLEYMFSEKIHRIDVNLSFWGPNEYINSHNATAVIQYKNSSGQWITILDLLNDISLSTNRYNQDTYTIIFPEGTYEYRYYMTADAIGTSNRGRISIGNTTFYMD